MLNGVRHGQLSIKTIGRRKPSKLQSFLFSHPLILLWVPLANHQLFQIHHIFPCLNTTKENRNDSVHSWTEQAWHKRFTSCYRDHVGIKLVLVSSCLKDQLDHWRNPLFIRELIQLSPHSYENNHNLNYNTVVIQLYTILYYILLYYGRK